MTKMLLFSLLAILCLCGCSRMLAGTAPLAAAQEPATNPPQRGLRVLDVFPNSPAEAAGLQKMDLITEYGGYEIVDDASFFAAREKYEKSLTPTVEIVVWRGREKMIARVSTGRLGVDSVEMNKVSLQFSSLMNQVKVLSRIPEHLRQHEFKKDFENGGISAVLEKAKVLIDDAEREGTLTRTQVLVARIDMILDDAPEQEQKHQSEMLKQLLASQPVSYIHNLGNDKFFQQRRYRPAIACLNHYLISSPDDVTMRLNLAVSYNQMEMYDDAEREVNYVLSRNLRMSQHGYVVAYSAQARAALGRNDYSRSIASMEKVIALEKDPTHLLVIQLAAAQMGDRARFDDAVKRLKQTAPAEYDKVKLQVDAVQAHLLVKENRRDAASQLVAGWKNDVRAAGRVISYWRKLPHGMDVARTWAELSK